MLPKIKTTQIQGVSSREPVRIEIKKKVIDRAKKICEYPKCRKKGDYSCSLGKPQIDKEGRLFPVNDACFQNRRVRGGKGDV